MAGHTPGPWERKQVQDGEYTGPGDSPPGYAGDYYETNNVGSVDRETGDWTPVADCYRPADACLIAAAPDLLAACEQAAAILTEEGRDSFAHACWEAVRKARGGNIS